MTERIAYRIRRKDGLYSTGGSHPDWTSRGKIWNGRGPLICHLQQLGWAGAYRDAVVVTVRLVDDPDGAPVADLLAEVGNRKATREREARERSAADVEARERETLAALQARYGGQP
jgi:hypothetical protein